MKAVLYRKPGGPEVLEYTDVADPEPGPQDVVVRVVLTALNHLDVVQRSGWYAMPGFTLPHIAGMDVAGEVVAIGTDVTGTHIGDRVIIDPSLSEVPEGSRFSGRGDRYGELAVIGATVDGGYAEYCLAPASHVHVIPPAMSYYKAATFPTCWVTAWHALLTVGELQAGETVLIHAAGSGMSVAAIQLARWRGATVLATAGSDEKCAKAKEIGAIAAMNNRTGDVVAWVRAMTKDEGVDMVLDHVGAALFEQSMLSLRVRGRLINVGNTSGDRATIPSLGRLYGLGQRILGSDPYRHSEFARCWGVFCSNDFESAIDTVYSLSEAGRAQQQLLDSTFFGKILLDPSR